MKKIYELRIGNKLKIFLLEKNSAFPENFRRIVKFLDWKRSKRIGILRNSFETAAIFQHERLRSSHD